MRPRTWREVLMADYPTPGPDNPVCAVCKHCPDKPAHGCAVVGYDTMQHALPCEAWVEDFETGEPRCRCFVPAVSPQLAMFAEVPK